ncbi:hypothetical protein XPA_004478 [Xanthoria parietina]
MLCTHNVIGEASLPLFSPAGRNNMLHNGRKSNALMQRGEPLTSCCGIGDEVECVWSRAYSHICVPVNHWDPAETHRSVSTGSREKKHVRKRCLSALWVTSHVALCLLETSTHPLLAATPAKIATIPNMVSPPSR